MEEVCHFEVSWIEENLLRCNEHDWKWNWSVFSVTIDLASSTISICGSVQYVSKSYDLH